MRSAAALLAESTMIGVGSVRRTARMTARPSTTGSMRSSTMSAGASMAIAASALRPSVASTTRNPSRSRYIRTRRTIFGSSSTTRIGAGAVVTQAS